MKPFGRKEEKRMLLALLASIPFLVFVLWEEYGEFGLNELIITSTTLLFALGIVFFVKWYSNK